MNGPVLNSDLLGCFFNFTIKLNVLHFLLHLEHFCLDLLNLRLRQRCLLFTLADHRLLNLQLLPEVLLDVFLLAHFFEEVSFVREHQSFLEDVCHGDDAAVLLLDFGVDQVLQLGRLKVSKLIQFDHSGVEVSQGRNSPVQVLFELADLTSLLLVVGLLPCKFSSNFLQCGLAQWSSLRFQQIDPVLQVHDLSILCSDNSIKHFNLIIEPRFIFVECLDDLLLIVDFLGVLIFASHQLANFVFQELVHFL